MNQRQEDLLPHPQQLPHRFLHLGVLSPVPHLPDTLLDPLGRVALFLREGFVFFDDLSDPFKAGADLCPGARLLQAMAGRPGMLQCLL